MIINIFMTVGGSGAKKRAGSGEFAVSQVRRQLCCSLVSEDTSFRIIISP